MWSFALGALAGGVVGVLLAPRSGRETRAAIVAWREANRTSAPEGPAGYLNEALDLGAAIAQAGRERVERAMEAARIGAAEARQRLLDEWRR
ncbi:MAG: YtxH domain-containing protein [Chloroflexi bacterium]|nr:YtxH domain-containing protein [Chloroflexota bacterium]